MPIRTSRLASVLAPLLLTLLAGCAVQPIHGDRDGSLPRRAELEATPFFPQEIDHCGPAALATTLVAAGIDTTPEALAPSVFLPISLVPVEWRDPSGALVFGWSIRG